MTLPGSGALSLNDIIAEFGLASDATFPTEFYGLGGAPSSGALSFSDFYGRSNVIFTPDGGSVGASGLGGASYTLTCNKTATWTFTYTGSPNGSSNPLSGGAGTSIIFTIFTDGSTTESGVWHVTGVSGNVTRTFTVSLTANGVPPG